MRIEWWRKHRTHTDVTNTFCECEHTPDQGTALNTHRVQQGGSCTAGERGERVQLCTVDLISRPNHIPIPSRDWWFTVRFGTQSEQVSPCRSRDMSRDSFVLCCVCCVPVLRRERSWERSPGGCVSARAIKHHWGSTSGLPVSPCDTRTVPPWPRYYFFPDIFFRYLFFSPEYCRWTAFFPKG